MSWQSAPLCVHSCSVLFLIAVVQPVWWSGSTKQVYSDPYLTLSLPYLTLQSSGFGEVEYLKSISEMRWDSSERCLLFVLHME